jgi:hypothetical protein
MLADACEAAVRAERPNSVEGIEELVQKVIGGKMLDGQLDECDLTLHDLDEIRHAFVSILQGVFHPRVKYPDAKKPKETEGAKGTEEARAESGGDKGNRGDRASRRDRGARRDGGELRQDASP